MNWANVAGLLLWHTNHQANDCFVSDVCHSSDTQLKQILNNGKF